MPKILNLGCLQNQRIILHFFKSSMFYNSIILHKSNFRYIKILYNRPRKNYIVMLPPTVITFVSKYYIMQYNPKKILRAGKCRYSL